MTMDEILETEWSPIFERGRQNRMCVSFFKYGYIKDAYPHRVNAIESLKMRLDKYAETGNTEYLMDVANFAMIEFMLPAHPEAHFEGTDGTIGRMPHIGVFGKPRPTQAPNKDIFIDETKIKKAKDNT